MLSPLEFNESRMTCQLNDFPARHFFTTMLAGNMSPKYEKSEEALGNYEKCMNERGFASHKPVVILPEHSDNIVFAPRYWREAEEVKCDGIFTTYPEVAFILRPADCLPILMSTIDRYFVGLIHAGWRGTDLEIARQAVELAVKHYPIEPKDIFVGIGPGIHKCCYNDEETAQNLLKDRRWAESVEENSFGKFGFGAYIDLLNFNVKQLLYAGINPKHIKIASDCTCCSRDEKGNHLFFSHHRAQRTGEPEGRYAAVVSMI